MGILVGSEIFIRYKMKLIAVAFLIPFVYGDCPPPPNEPIECKGSDLICPGVEDSNGCMMPNWCLSVDPYAPCSAKATCPRMCPEGTINVPVVKIVTVVLCPTPVNQKLRMHVVIQQCVQFIVTLTQKCVPEKSIPKDAKWPCPTQKDDRGCEEPASCSIKGECS